MKIQYFLNIFPETLHVSADISHHQVYAPQVETQVIKVKYTTELNSNLKRTAIEHSCSSHSPYNRGKITEKPVGDSRKGPN
jgi:hypothetical protein